MDVARLWKEIAHDSDLWALCGVAMALGIVGGIAQAFASADGGRPGWRTLLQRGLLGAVAAGAVLYFAKPDSGGALVSGSLVAGYAGQALLDALAARARLKVEQQAAAAATAALATKTTAAATALGAVATAERLLATAETQRATPDVAALRAQLEVARHQLTP
ncbi:MAG: hypothetical protein JNK64_27105 [Myxococcales bacterium]|nr:hypothetical protein [Myxococcales bacterium]